MAIHPFKIKPVVKNYLWGTLGKQSLVARLAGEGDPNQHYAELWVGGHPQASSIATLSSGNTALDELIKAHGQELLGERVNTRFPGELPFLFKILSIQEPLSIQAHPDLTLAEELHSRDSKNYPDKNHKPEIAIALSEFKLLYGFRPLSELVQLTQEHPELNSLLNDSKAILDEEGAFVEALYSSLALAESEKLAVITRAIAARLTNSVSELSEQEKLFINLNSKFGDTDIGVVTSLLMNFVTLQPFESIYTAPNILHAYVSGEIVECMATSDNVVRGGLTPKFKDVSTLVAMLDYQASLPNLVQAKQVPNQINCLRYAAPVTEFCLEMLSGPSQITFQRSQEFAIYFCLNGRVRISSKAFSIIELVAGESCLVPATYSPCLVEVIEGTIFRVVVP